MVGQPLLIAARVCALMLGCFVLLKLAATTRRAWYGQPSSSAWVRGPGRAPVSTRQA